MKPILALLLTIDVCFSASPITLNIGGVSSESPVQINVITVTNDVPVSKVFYLAARTDNQSGSGSMSNPFDVSTAGKLDRVWYGLVSNPSNSVGTRIVFLPGIYQATNLLQLDPANRNMTFIGYGATVCFSNSALNRPNGLFTHAWSGNDGVSWEGFDLDVGSQVNYAGNGKTGGFIVKGRNCVIRNCVVRNMTVNDPAPSQGHEAFGIILESTNGICANNLVNGVIAKSTVAGFTGIAILGEGNTITGNTVDLNENDPANYVSSFAYTIYGSENTFSGNACRGVDVALSMDAAGENRFERWHDNLIVGNQLSANAITVRIDNNTQSYHDWSFIGNHIQTKSVWLSLYTYNEAYRSNRVSGFVFSNNRFVGEPRNYNNIILGNYLYHTFTDNVFSKAPIIYFQSNSPPILAVGNSAKGVPITLK